MKKLIFMFIVREGFLQQRLWEAFFRDADPALYDCFYYSIDSVDEPNVRNLVRFPNTLNPQYGHVTYVETVLMMLEHGLREPRNEKFILLSESCIPLESFDRIFHRVMQDDKTYLYHFQVGGGDKASKAGETKPEYLETEAVAQPERSGLFRHFFGRGAIRWVSDRFNEIRDKSGIERKRFHKFVAQGICFQRAFAEFLVETKADLANYADVRFIEEYYYLCPLNKRKIPFDRYVRKENLMSASWWNYRPKVYSELSPDLIDRMRAWEYCFLRKVAQDCHIDDELMAHILRRQGGPTESDDSSKA